MRERLKDYLPSIILAAAVLTIGIKIVSQVSDIVHNEGKTAATENVLLGETQNWGLGFGEEGKQPTGTVPANSLK